MKNCIKEYFYFIFVFAFFFSFCSCGKEKTLGKSTKNFIQQSSSVSKSKNTPVVVEEGVNIHIKNSKGEIDIKDSKLAEELIQIVENSSKVIKTGASCPFGNKVTIYKNQVIQKEFIIAEDGCNTIKRADGSIIEIEKTIYEKIEGALNNLNNSLNRINLPTTK